MSAVRRRVPVQLPRPPRWLVFVVILSVVTSWIPLALIARSRALRSPQPRVHLFRDMGEQPKYLAQSTHPQYADGRAMRPPVEGAVPRGLLRDDDHYYRGYETDGNLRPVRVELEEGGVTLAWYEAYPDQVDVDIELLNRGRQRYNIYCAVCHGHAGYGDGPIQRRVERLAQRHAFVGGPEDPDPTAGWVPVRNLHDDAIRDQPVGQIFNTISRGFGRMPAYDTKIPVEDRWAITAYMRALLLGQHLPADAAPEDLRRELTQSPRREQSE